MPDQVRTIVTHINDDGTSGMTERLVARRTSVDDLGRPTFGGNLVWGTTDGTSTVGAGEQPDAVTEPFFPGPGGHRFVVFEFLPEPGAAPRIVVRQGDPMPGLLDAFDKDRPGMHRTDTIDYTYVISGEMTLELDDGEVPVRAGDCVVQQGTWHAWRNRAAEPCVVAAVLIGADRKP
ncbi:cupin domain-containing protein [Amycolatopsis acidicola]|uniref:Cupin domain-containing protein n=1 Tax=Amycolatopsis acidicola TaxID=2596893 RepID=A0A5N0VA97_9PSEU|nr:cupin domain-containing protein [Amycolatopsis acidicola]KAA9163309.1 cupin domain-containing protein [Amycolatopsis acidicola]